MIKQNNEYSTYKIFSNCFSREELEFIEKEFEKRGNWKKPIGHITNVTFLFTYYCKMSVPKFIFNIKSDLSGDINWGKDPITDKVVFYDAFKLFYPEECQKYMPEQYVIMPLNYTIITPEILKNDIWILKSSKGMCGEGNKIITSYDDYINYIKTFDEKSDISWVLSKYIKNVTLINGYKFHLRVPLIYHKPNGYYATRSMIWTAKDKYILEDWHNKDIHDTRLRTSYSKKLLFPRDLDIDDEHKKNIDKQIHDISKYIVQILNKVNIKCWPQTQQCFDVIGLDLLIDSDYRIWLLEINQQPAIRNEDQTYRNEIIQGMIYHVVDSSFPPKHKVPDNGLYKKIQID